MARKGDVMQKQRHTGKAAAKSASSVLKDARTGRDSKRAAASALSQAAPKAKPSRSTRQK